MSFDSVQFSHSVMSNSLWPHGLQHARLPYPSPTPRACSNWCSFSQWCHPTISSSVVPFSSCLQSFPASGSFPMSQFFASGGQSIGASASASVLPISLLIKWHILGLVSHSALPTALWAVPPASTFDTKICHLQHLLSAPILSALTAPDQVFARWSVRSPIFFHFFNCGQEATLTANQKRWGWVSSYLSSCFVGIKENSSCLHHPHWPPALLLYNC